MSAPNFGLDFQKELVKLMLTDISFLTKCLNYLEDEFFSAGPMRWVFSCIKEHYRVYGKIPNTTIFSTEILNKVAPEDREIYIEFLKSLLTLEVNNADYVKDQLKLFVKKNLFVRAFEESAILWNGKKVDEALELMGKTMHQINSLTFNPPDRSFFFEDYRNRQLQRITDASDQTIIRAFPTGILHLDEVFGPSGGLSRGEVGLIVGDTKSGKSIALNHMAFACSRIGGKVLVLSLEGSRKLTEDRLDARFAEERYQNIKFGEYSSHDVEERVYREYEMLKGNMVVRGFTDKWDYNVVDVDHELDELAAMGFKPDLVVVDYLDLLYPREFDPRENLYERQTRVAQDLHQLAVNRNMALWTASQAKRPTNKANDPNFVLRAMDMADCYGKARTVDMVLTLNFTDEERLRGVMRLYVDRYRDNEAGQVIPLQTDFRRMIFYSAKLATNGILTDADMKKHGNRPVTGLGMMPNSLKP